VATVKSREIEEDSLPDPNVLLGTLTQASAVMVAIIGGFLVSRLVAISSEREGIKRQLREARERLGLLQSGHEEARQNRLAWSKRRFCDTALDDLIENRNGDLDQLVVDNVPRGSSVEEMTPYAQDLKRRVESAFDRILALLQPGDSLYTDLDDLKGLGLKVASEDEDIYDKVLYRIKSARPANAYGPILLPPMTGVATRQIDARRFDEALNAEVELAGQIKSGDQEVKRLGDELYRLGKPVGVISATWMLGVLSLTGIVAPVIVMALSPYRLAVWLEVILISLFIIGLFAVLYYIIWYLRKLNDQSE
jgi:hypothetical protein